MARHVRKMDTSIIRAGKEGGMCRVPSRKIPQQASASLVAMGSFLLLRPWSIHGKTTNMSYLFLSEHAPPKTWGSAAIVWPRTHIYQSMCPRIYLYRHANERTSLPFHQSLIAAGTFWLVVGLQRFSTHTEIVWSAGASAARPALPVPRVPRDWTPTHPRRALPAMVPRHRTGRCIVSA